jgi:hypothetical protein
MPVQWLFCRIIVPAISPVQGSNGGPIKTAMAIRANLASETNLKVKKTASHGGL